jgi:hypothetical protein
VPEPFNPDLFVARWYCSKVNPESMPEFAADALEAGHDGRALRRLAGLINPTSWDVGDLFKEALLEIGNVKVLSKEQALMFLSRTTAANIIDGRIDPLDGAETIAGYAMEAGYPESLVEFFALADMPRWGEHAPPRSKLVEDIFEQARLLLANDPE